MSLPNDDIAMVHVRQISQFLRLLAPKKMAPSPIKYFLTNGDIEKQLKLFIGAAWEKGDPETRAFVMDKRFRRDDARREDSCEIDFLAFDRKSKTAPKLRFWIEAKCGFASAQHSSMERGATVTTAKDAVRKITRGIEKFPESIDGEPTNIAQCPIYIVHFLTSLPDNGDPLLPNWVRSKYPDRKGRQYNLPIKEAAKKLGEFYQRPGIYSGRENNIQDPKAEFAASDTLSIWKTPNVYAVIVKLHRL